MDCIALAFEQPIDHVTLSGCTNACSAAAFAMDVEWMLTGTKNESIERHLSS
jgi:hypothetical protein